MNNPFSESPLQQLDDSLLQKKEITLYIKRDDLIHPHIQGNKWRKGPRDGTGPRAGTGACPVNPGAAQK